MVMVRSFFLFLFFLTTGISAVSAKACKEEGKFIVFCLGGTTGVKVTERSGARKIFHECDILDLDTDDV